MPTTKDVLYATGLFLFLDDVEPRIGTIARLGLL